MALSEGCTICRSAMLSAFLSAFLSTSALADCFESLGQTGCPSEETFPVSDLRKLSCENLWLVRNSIYNAKGLCFASKRGQEQFDNADCFVTDASAIKLNQHEQANASEIAKIEKEKHCK